MCNSNYIVYLSSFLKIVTILICPKYSAGAYFFVIAIINKVCEFHIPYLYIISKEKRGDKMKVSDLINYWIDIGYDHYSKISNGDQAYVEISTELFVRDMMRLFNITL